MEDMQKLRELYKTNSDVRNRINKFLGVSNEDWRRTNRGNDNDL